MPMYKLFSSSVLTPAIISIQVAFKSSNNRGWSSDLYKSSWFLFDWLMWKMRSSHDTLYVWYKHFSARWDLEDILFARTSNGWVFIGNSTIASKIFRQQLTWVWTRDCCPMSRPKVPTQKQRKSPAQLCQRVKQSLIGIININYDLLPLMLARPKYVVATRIYGGMLLLIWVVTP